MINIISKSVLSSYTSGPQKVVKNLIKGLDLINYPYIINGDLNSCKRLWIHDDIKALEKIRNLSQDIKVIVGPNLFVLPRQIPEKINLENVVYLHPSFWAQSFWSDFGFDKCTLDSWPTGIDTHIYKPSDKEKEIVLIYFKQREKKELEKVENILKQKNIKYKTIIYGSYKQSDYLKLLEKSKYIIWIGRQESQGIALEEALAMNIPILVWDVKNIGHWHASKKEMSIFNKQENEYTNTSSAYFFDETCGVKIKEEKDLEYNIDIMERDWSKFEPRKYILNNLSLEKQAKDFVNLYDKHYNISYEEGLKEEKLNSNKWINARFYYRLFSKLKDFYKKIK